MKSVSSFFKLNKSSSCLKLYPGQEYENGDSVEECSSLLKWLDKKISSCFSYWSLTKLGKPY